MASVDGFTVGFTLGGAGLATAGSLVLAAAGAIDPSQLAASLTVGGPLGAIAGFLLLRLREKDKEERVERGTAWTAVGALRDELRTTKDVLKDELQANGQQLVRIATLLERSPPK